MNETIAAISTPFGEGAIAVLRLSGPRALEIAEAVFHGPGRVADLPARTQQFGSIREDGRRIDDVLLTVFRAPASYTGEDVIEIAGHGGVLVSRRVLEFLLRQGARAAHPGEFTQRAFLHGKMDLTQAEAVMDLITAQTDLALQAASEQLEGRLGARIRHLREALLDLLAQVEAYIDFPDEDIDPATGDALLARLDVVRSDMAALRATAQHGRILREGVRTVIYGAPNVGKSSLLNLLLGHERAIVSARPGTTRDVIEETIDLRGLPLRLIDTAGVRDAEDEIEQAGIARARQQIARADLLLHVVDATQARPAASEWQVEGFQEGRSYERGSAILVLNKCDLGEHASWRSDPFERASFLPVRISCLKNEGLAQLEDAIVDRLAGGRGARRDWSLAINARHGACLEAADAAAEAARSALVRGLSPEFVAEELRAALQAVGAIVGHVESEDVLGKIFSTFCIGK